MALTATFYNVSDDPKTIGKTLGTGKEVTNIRPTESCDLLNPTFILDYDDGSLADYNYVVVGAPFNRNYFIQDMKIDIGKKIVISCSVDVLETYAAGILIAPVVITRTENPALIGNEQFYHTPIPDSKFPSINAKRLESYVVSGSPFTGGYEKVFWEVYNGIPGQPDSISLTIGDYFWWQKWKYQLTGTADSAFAQYVEESYPQASDPKVHNGSLITVSGYRYKVRVDNDYAALYISPYQ